MMVKSLKARSHIFTWLRYHFRHDDGDGGDDDKGKRIQGGQYIKTVVSKLDTTEIKEKHVQHDQLLPFHWGAFLPHCQFPPNCTPAIFVCPEFPGTVAIGVTELRSGGQNTICGRITVGNEDVEMEQCVLTMCKLSILNKSILCHYVSCGDRKFFEVFFFSFFLKTIV